MSYVTVGVWPARFCKSILENRVMTAGKCLAVLFSFVFCLSGCSSGPNDPVTVSVSPRTAYVGSGQSMQFTATVTNSSAGVNWALTGSGRAFTEGVASGDTIDTGGNFTAPTVTQNSTVTITATSITDPTKSGSVGVTIVAPGVVTATANAQVAQYAITVPDGLSIFVEFSKDTSYHFTTSSVPAPSGGGSVPILVAGMLGNTPYHMRAVFQPTGSTTSVFTDVDHVFTTSAYPASNVPSLTTATTQGQLPQSGVELIDTTIPAVADLSGNVLWTYNAGATVAAGTNPIKLLPNGHFLINFSSPYADGLDSDVREIDLSGKVFWDMTAAQLNAALATATCSGCNITVVGTHHDFAVLPNGHMVFIAATQQTISGTVVTGDVLIDLDQNHNPVWLWNEFDHLDVNRHPMMFPDWTHTNAVVYSPDDKALMVSSRHQGWVFKVNYLDGAGDGSIIWKLGYQGDFNLLPGLTNSMDPEDWFSAQHDANIISTNTSGVIDILMFDNGNQRIVDSSGDLCGSVGNPCGSRVPIYHIDENAKTAEITWIDDLAPTFSSFGGNARLQANGNIEFDECASSLAPPTADIFEVTKTKPPQTVWHMHINGQNSYRTFRIGSLYPGVQW